MPTAEGHLWITSIIPLLLRVEDFFSFFLAAGYEMVVDVKKQYKGNEMITHLSQIENCI